MVLDYIKWNKRASLLYALGMWTMCGSYGYYAYKHRNDPAVPKQKEEEELNPNMKKYETAHTRTIIVYKENFVPYSTRLMNFFKSFSNNPAPEELTSQTDEEQK